MKKLIFALCAAVVLVGAACSAGSRGSSSAHGGKTSSRNGASSKTNTGASDTKESTASPSSAAPTKISPQEAKQKIDSGGVIVLDVRTESEYTEGHIPGARLLTNETITEAPADLPKDAVLLVYCRSGRRSAEAAKKLAALGYHRVYDFGGIIDWPYETESGSPKVS